MLGRLLRKAGPALGFWCAAGLLVIPAIVAEFRAPLNADAAWLSYAAESLLRSRKLYIDILEINPPLIIWLNLPLALTQQLTGLSGQVVFRVSMVVVLAMSVWACFGLVRHLPGPEAPTRSRIAMLSLIFVLYPLVGGTFGQREHIALALVLPLIPLVALRIQRRPITGATALAVSISAAVGFSLKPHFLAVWFLLIAYRTWCTKRERSTLMIEDWAVAVTGFLYVLAVIAFAPGYFGFVHGTAREYLAFGQHGLREILLSDTPALLLYAAVLSWLVLRVPRRDGGLGGPLVVAGLGFVIAVALQHKGWSYHYYPVTACAVLLGISTVSAAVTSPTSSHAWKRVAWRAGLGIYGVLLSLFTAMTLGGTIRRAAGELTDRQATQLELRAFVGSLHDARSILVLSSQLRDAFPLVNDSGLEWNGSFPVMWVPLVRYRSNAGSSKQTVYRSPDRMDPVEQFAFLRVVSDFTMRPPDVLVVESRGLNERRIQFPGGFDFCVYFGQDPRFASLLHQYVPVGDVRGLLIFRRAKESQE